jgi:hypothetical protein
VIRERRNLKMFLFLFFATLAHGTHMGGSSVFRYH